MVILQKYQKQIRKSQNKIRTNEKTCKAIERV